MYLYIIGINNRMHIEGCVHYSSNAIHLGYGCFGCLRNLSMVVNLKRAFPPIHSSVLDNITMPQYGQCTTNLLM